MKVTLKCDEVNKLNKDVKNLESKIADGVKEIDHREELIDRLTGEITALQDEMTRAHDKLTDYENNVRKLRSKLEIKAKEVLMGTNRH